MRKGFIDMWVLIGLLFTLLFLGLAMTFLLTGNDSFLKPAVEEVKPVAGLIFMRRLK